MVQVERYENGSKHLTVRESAENFNNKFKLQEVLMSPNEKSEQLFMLGPGRKWFDDHKDDPEAFSKFYSQDSENSGDEGSVASVSELNFHFVFLLQQELIPFSNIKSGPETREGGPQKKTDQSFYLWP